MLLLGMLADIPEKSGLACTRFSRQENGLASVLNEVQSILKLLVLGVGYKRQVVSRCFEVIGNLVIDISNYSKIPKCFSASAMPLSSTLAVT